MRIPKLTVQNLAFLSILFLFNACYKEVSVDVKTDFDHTVDYSSNSFPRQVTFTNKSTGAEYFKWEFEHGTPSTSSERNPGIVFFPAPGSYKVKLEAWNADGRMTKELIVKLDSAVTAGFDTAVIANYFAPATVRLSNSSTGASHFKWNVAGGSWTTSEAKNPPDVTFSQPGVYNITLRASNGRDTVQYARQINVLPRLATDFEIVPSFDDEDYEAPLTAFLQNKTISGLNWTWTASGGVINNNSAKDPSIYFSAPGTYNVTLRANNIKDTQTITKTIVVKPNSNLRTHHDIKFGISSAHGTTGSFYSTRLRKSFTQSENLDTSGKWIDLGFFGINQSFSYNKFISPDSAQFYTFNSIPQAKKTVFINNLDECECGISVSVADFNNMANDNLLQSLPINSNMNGWHSFDNLSLPRLVLFKTEDGRKGIIKIKQFVQNGAQSYILTDIKVQKNF